MLINIFLLYQVLVEYGTDDHFLPFMVADLTFFFLKKNVIEIDFL